MQEEMGRPQNIYHLTTRAWCSLYTPDGVCSTDIARRRVYITSSPDASTVQVLSVEKENKKVVSIRRYKSWIGIPARLCRPAQPTPSDFAYSEYDPGLWNISTSRQRCARFSLDGPAMDISISVDIVLYMGACMHASGHVLAGDTSTVFCRILKLSVFTLIHPPLTLCSSSKSKVVILCLITTYH